MRFKLTNDGELPGYDFTSGHKGVTFKHCVWCTMEETPIAVSECQPGRRNHVYLFVLLLAHHCVNAFSLLDGGYPGVNGHGRIPD